MAASRSTLERTQLKPALSVDKSGTTSEGSPISGANAKKTIITVSGQSSVLEKLTPGLSGGLSTEAVEWKRSYGRATKIVNLDADFLPLDPNRVQLNSRHLRDIPVLHTFWIECPDLDTFKASVKDEILQWITLLRKCGVSQDWMVTIVEPADVRKTSKLLARTSVLDKLKQEVGGRQPDRCCSLIDPTKNDSRAAESWQTLLHKVRVLALQGYNRVLGKFEENMRSERERRNDPSWNFCDYFLLQEELAFTYEMLGVYDEALVQYDELDALFTQFILNSNVTASPMWLQRLAESCSNWSGLSLNPAVNHVLRNVIVGKNPSLLDLRNYLFSRQCAMILKVHNPLEMAKRSLSFLHNSVQEINILELSFPKGSIACWVFLSCLEILLTYEKYSDSSNRIQLYCLHTASLWEYARNKLLELGNLCGLMPNMEPSSKQIHRVVELSSGIRDDHYVSVDRKGRNPIEKLKEALSSKQAFQKYYLELSELAISTYKHIGRIRSARYIGIDLAKFYLLLEQIPQATTFLLDALKTFQGEGWDPLEWQTLTEVAHCYRKLDEKEKLVRTCAQIAAFKAMNQLEDKEEPDEDPKKGTGPKIKLEPTTTTMNTQKTESKKSENEDKSGERMKFFKELLALAEEIPSEVNIDACPNMIKIISCQITNRSMSLKVIPGAEVTLALELFSNFPDVVKCDEIAVALAHSEPLPVSLVLEAEKKKLRKTHSGGAKRTLSNSSTSSSVGATGSNSGRSTPMLSREESAASRESLDDLSEETNRLLITEQFDRKQDKTLASTRLLCRNAAQILKRKDSSGMILRDGNIKKADYTFAFRLVHVSLKPGGNCFELNTVAGPVGKYDLSQLSVQHKKLNFILANLKESLSKSFSVISELPSLSINSSYGELLCGVKEIVTLSIATGSQTIKKGTVLQVTCSRGLKGRQTEEAEPLKGTTDELQSQFEIVLPEGNPFEVLQVRVTLLAELPVATSSIVVKDNKGQNWIQSVSDHLLRIDNIWKSPGSEVVELPLHFIRPFHVSVRLTTSYAKKIVEISVIGDCAKATWFEISNPGLILMEGDKAESKDISLEAICGGEDSYEISKDGSCTFFYDLNVAPAGFEMRRLPTVLKTRATLDYCRIDEISGDYLDDKRSIQIMPDFVDYTTLYILSSRIIAAQGAEICRSATICSLILDLEQVCSTEHTSIMYEVLADQAVWAVCGRAAAVIDMSSAQRQTINVEVMPLVGGHLALPKVRLSKYIVPQEGVGSANQNDKRDSSSSMSKLEPFSPGQIFNASRFQRVHVLANASRKKDSTSVSSDHQPHSQPPSLTSLSLEMQSLSSRSLLLQSKAIGTGPNPISLQ